MAKLSFSQIFGLILGSAEGLVPVFIHNPKSQQLEGVIMTDANTIFSELTTLQGAQSSVATPATGTTTTTTTTAS